MNLPSLENSTSSSTLQGDMHHFITPFLFGGIAVFKFNPTTEAADGNTYELQPLGTEGQGTTEYPDMKKVRTYNRFHSFWAWPEVQYLQNLCRRVGMGHALYVHRLFG
jgi:hypothetical protein